MIVEDANTVHPYGVYLKLDVTTSAWCPGCGIGTVVNAFVQTLMKLAFDPEHLVVVTGNGCTEKIGEYLRFGSPQTASGSVIGYALDFKQQRPDHKTVVFVNNIDFCNHGTEDLERAGKEQCQLCVFHINNIIYTVTKNGSCAATPFIRQNGNDGFELPFNCPHTARLAGARYVARWTSLHVRRLMHSMLVALQKPGLSYIEIISPCLIYNAIDENIGETLEKMQFCHDNSRVQSDVPTHDLDIRRSDKIIMGVFVDGA